MSKILATQLSGLFQKIIQREEFSIEETARLLAQAAVGQGSVYLACFDEMTAIEMNALHCTEPFYKLLPWSEHTKLTGADRVCIFTRSCHHHDVLTLARKLFDAFIPFAVVASEPANEDNELANLAYTYISTGIIKGIMPNDTGERVVIPHTMASLFVYEAIKLTYDEIISVNDAL